MSGSEGECRSGRSLAGSAVKGLCCSQTRKTGQLVSREAVGGKKYLV